MTMLGQISKISFAPPVLCSKLALLGATWHCCEQLGVAVCVETLSAKYTFHTFQKPVL